MAKKGLINPFPEWRKKWSSDPDCAQLIRRADELITRRRLGNQHFPAPLNDESSRLAAAMAGIAAVLREFDQVNSEEHHAALLLFVSELNSANSASLWPRWLCLEDCLRTAWASRDILFAALTMRTMCEELQRMHSLSAANEAISSVGQQNSAETRALKDALSFLVNNFYQLDSATILNG